jgi:hypothetical protein
MMPFHRHYVNTLLICDKALTCARQMQIFRPLKPILLLIVLIAFFPPFQQKRVEREAPDLSVVKFSWAKELQNTSMIRGAQRPGGPITTPIPDARDHQSRRSDMRNMEKKAAFSSQLPPGDRYHMRLEVKNTGTNVVTNLIWEFRPTGMPEDYEPKQYLCVLRLKPEEKKTLELWTPYAPVKVVRVSERADALKDGEVVINKIEYDDGSFWKKRDWYIDLPADSAQRLSEGKCSVF